MKKLQSEGADIVNLCVGEPDLPPSEWIMNAAIRAILSNQVRYTASEGLEALRKSVADLLNTEGWNVDPKREVLITAGAKPALFQTFQALAGEGDECLVPTPSYPSYPSMIEYARAKTVFVPGRFENGFKVTPDDIGPCLTSRSRFFILNSPVNPTGSVYSATELKELLNFLADNEIICINDDVYRHFIYNESQKNEISEVLKDCQKKMVLIRSFSKEFSMTGWRIGYISAPEEMISMLKILQGHAAGNPQTASQYAALTALERSTETRIPLDIFKKRRAVSIEKLKGVRNLSIIKPEGAFYLFADVRHYIRQKDSETLCRELMTKAGVAVTPGTAFGQEGFIRISYADGSRLEEGLDRLCRGLGSE